MIDIDHRLLGAGNSLEAEAGLNEMMARSIKAAELLGEALRTYLREDAAAAEG